MESTSREIARRLQQATEGHPLAPPTPFGRQAWLREKLQQEAGMRVSANTVSRWFNGLSRPRDSNIEKIAKVLKVDSLWLMSGRKGVVDARPVAPTKSTFVQASGSVLLFAGLVELLGGRVIFADKDAYPVDLHVNLGDGKYDAVIVKAKVQGDRITALLPEPRGNARVFAVVVDPQSPDMGVIVLDVSDVEVRDVAGYSSVEVQRRGTGEFRAVSSSGAAVVLLPFGAIGQTAAAQ